MLPLLRLGIGKNRFAIFLIFLILTWGSAWAFLCCTQGTLTKTALAGLPVYTVQNVWLPQAVCDHVDKHISSFIWSSKQDGKSLHFVNWDQVTAPKHYGGLGIKLTRQQNIALLGKLTWEDVFRNKYLHSSDLWTAVLSSSASKSLAELRDGFGWRVGDGRNISLWYDRWCRDSELSLTVPRLRMLMPISVSPI